MYIEGQLHNFTKSTGPADRRPPGCNGPLPLLMVRIFKIDSEETIISNNIPNREIIIISFKQFCAGKF